MHRLGLAVVLLVAVPRSQAMGQKADAPAAVTAAATARPEVTVEMVQSRLKQVSENVQLDAATKAKLAQIYNTALEQLTAASDSLKAGAAFKKGADEAPSKLQDLQAQLKQPPAEAAPQPPQDAKLPQLQQSLLQAEARYSDAQRTLADIQAEPNKRTARRTDLLKRIDSAKSRLQDMQAQLGAQPVPGNNADVSAASRLLLLARIKATEAELDSYEKELQFFEATGELLAAQRDVAAQKASQAEKSAKAWRELVNDQRRRDAERQAEEARLAAAKAQPALKTLAENNEELATQRQDLAAKIERAARDYEQIDEKYVEIDGRFNKTKKRVEIAGNTQSIGLSLRTQRANLPEIGQYRRALAARAAEIAQLNLQMIDFQESRDALADLDRSTNKYLDDLDETTDARTREKLRPVVRKLLQTRRAILDALTSDSTNYFSKLVDLDVRVRQLIGLIKSFEKYCDERILWIHSTTFFGRAHFADLWGASAAMASRSGWKQVGFSLLAVAREDPITTVLFLLIITALFLAGRPLRRRIRNIGQQVAESRASPFSATLRVLALTIVVAEVWPATMGYIGYRLTFSEDSSGFSPAVGRGLLSTALICALFEFFRTLCCRHGLGESHFDWPARSMKRVRRALRLLILIGAPLVFLTATTEAMPSEMVKSSLGRVAFVAALALLGVVGYRLSRSSDSILAASTESDFVELFNRVRSIWPIAAVGVPLILAILDILGFHYTALQLAWRFVASLWLVAGVIVAHAIASRWIKVLYRNLGLKRLRERREAAEASSGGPAQILAAAGGAPNPVPEVKLSEVSRQARNVLRLVMAITMIVGLWLVWANVFPAFAVLKHIEIWTTNVPAPAGASQPTVTRQITVADLLMALLLATLTFAASKNLPGVLEITVLQRLPLDPGGRYAVSTLARYVIVVIGVIVAFGAIGVGWSQVQWLVAAVSVGLGFGLQEIFSNFVSGVILLFERPMRVGDIVSVGDVTGTVSRIRMRATTILDWDMREFIVPNREFITGRLMNWTLSSKVSRMTMVVGVAYGTPPNRVRELLLQIAHEHPLVLKDPPAHALLDEFADSTMNFTFRVYMGTRDVYLQLRHELMTSIAECFKREGIEIAFPQRDVRLIISPIPIPSDGPRFPEKSPAPIRSDK